MERGWRFPLKLQKSFSQEQWVIFLFVFCCLIWQKELPAVTLKAGTHQADFKELAATKADGVVASRQQRRTKKLRSNTPQRLKPKAN